MDFAGTAAARERPRFGLPAALAVSVALHILLLLIFQWLPDLTPEVAAAEPEQQLLKFTFAPDNADVDTNESAKGEVPFETPQTQPAETSELMQPSQEAAGLETIPLPPNEAVLQPQPEPTPVPTEQQLRAEAEEEREARPADPTEEPTTEQPDDPVEKTGTELPEDSESALAAGAVGTEKAPSSKEPAQGLDLNSAMRDFQRQMDQSRQSRPAQPGGGSKQNVYVPDLGTLPMQGAPYGILEFSSRDYDWSEYSSQIYWAILKAWYLRIYRTTADFEKWAHTNGRYLLNHNTTIEFVIERTGNVSGLRLIRGSSCGPLDDSALDALAEVVLPPLPNDFPRDSELLRGTFVARAEVMALRPMLRQLYNQGFFN